MASFDVAIAFVAENEGGWFDHPDDHGGETQFGVTRRTLSTYQNVTMKLPGVTIRELTIAQAKQVHRWHGWSWRFNQIDSQPVATKLLDITTLRGFAGGVKLIQQACNFVVGDPAAQLTVDGDFGPKTLSAINSVPSSALLLALIREQSLFHSYQVSRDPTQAVFLWGWMRRTWRLPPGSSLQQMWSEVGSDLIARLEEENEVVAPI